MTSSAPRHRALARARSADSRARTGRVLVLLVAGVVIAVFGGALQSLAAMVVVLVLAPHALGETDYAPLTWALAQMSDLLKHRE
jgi:hypothetical protein